MLLSVVIPAYNEEGSIGEMIEKLVACLAREFDKYEILVVNDHSYDRTAEIVSGISRINDKVKVISNAGPNGFGFAVRYGLEHFSGDCVAIMMADMSDSPDDLLSFYNEMLEKKVDCVFGSRFIKGGKLIDYPMLKLIINRLANNIVRMTVGVRYNDFTNAFKLYSRETIEGLKPFLAPHFNLTLELPLKAVVRGYSYTILPNSWVNRKHGESKLKIKEMGSRYFFILLYCLIEKYFSKGDFRKGKK